MSILRSAFPALFLALAISSQTPRAEAQVLVWSIGDSQSNAQGVANYLAATGFFSSVTAHDGADYTLTNLVPYQKILFYTNSASGADMTAIGNMLASYATGDPQRTLVLATFSWANQGTNTLAGNIISQGLSPFVFNGTSAYSTVAMSSNDGSAFFAGVNVLGGYYHDRVVLTSGSDLHGTWTDGTPILAAKGNVVGVNLFPGSASGDYQRLFANALLAVPEPPTIAALASGLVVLYLHRRRRLSRR